MVAILDRSPQCKSGPQRSAGCETHAGCHALVNAERYSRYARLGRTGDREGRAIRRHSRWRRASRGNGDVAARRIVNDFRQVSLAQLQFEVQLGMTPVSRASVTRDHGKSDFDLVAAMAAQQEAEQAGEPERSGEPEG